MQVAILYNRPVLSIYVRDHGASLRISANAGFVTTLNFSTRQEVSRAAYFLYIMQLSYPTSFPLDDHSTVYASHSFTR